MKAGPPSKRVAPGTPTTKFTGTPRSSPENAFLSEAISAWRSASARHQSKIKVRLAGSTCRIDVTISEPRAERTFSRHFCQARSRSTVPICELWVRR
ncbi:hypothetical protein D3C71_1807650 [compost metagenome]